MQPDLSKLRPGGKVYLDNPTKIEPLKPWPRGWHEVVEVGTYLFDIRVVGDDRWVPVRLIKDIVT